MREPRYFLPGLIAVALVWTAAVGPLITAGAADMRMLTVFQSDEVTLVNLVHAALAARTLRIIYGAYGHLYFNIALIPLLAWTAVRSMPSEMQLLFTLRTLSFLFGLGSVVAVFAWAAADIGLVAGVVAALVMCTSPVLALWAEMAHPDTAQIFFLILALFWASRMLSTQSPDRPLVLASACAGLAFATKYAGLFVLPVIAVVLASEPARRDAVPGKRAVRIMRVLLAAVGVVAVAVAVFASPARAVTLLSEDGRADSPGILMALLRVRLLAGAAGVVSIAIGLSTAAWKRLQAAPRAVDWLRGMFVALGVFTVVFVCVSPYSLRRLAFVKGVYFETTKLANTTLWQSAANWSHTSSDTFGVPVLVVAVLGAGLAFRERIPRRRYAAVVPFGFAAFYALVLLIRIRLSEAHYALPVLPFVAMLVGYAAQRAAEAIPVRRVAAFAVIAVAGLVMTPRFVVARDLYLHRAQTNPAVVAGRWLACAVPPGARVAYDYLSYVPPEFEQAQPTWGGTLEWRDSVRPDVIVVQRDMARENLQHPATHDYYSCLVAGTCGFEQWYENKDVQVFGKTAQTATLRTPGACQATVGRPFVPAK